MPIHFQTFSRIATRGFREIYRAVNFQDRLINKAWSGARFNRSVRRGVRHGTAGGAIAATVIEQYKNPLTDNGIQTPFQPQTYPFYKTYNRQARSYSDKYKGFRKYDSKRRCPRPRKRY